MASSGEETITRCLRAFVWSSGEVPSVGVEHLHGELPFLGEQVHFRGISSFEEENMEKKWGKERVERRYSAREEMEAERKKLNDKILIDMNKII
ncbi:hypothetical protein COP1_025360 [Malus domestica]